MRKLLLLFLLLPYIVQAQEFDRNIQLATFVPKGQWLWGGAFSYNQATSDSYDFLMLSNINGTYYNFKVVPYVGYFIKDNMCIGGKFSYNRSLVRFDNLDLDLGDDLDLDMSIKDYYSLSHVYSGAIILRNYMSLGKSKRFGLYNELKAAVGGGQGKLLSGKGENLSGTYQNIFEVEVGMVPGIIAFITNNAAIEASVNVLGFKYKKYNQIKNQIEKGSLENSSLSLKVDLFSINIGMSFYFTQLNIKGKKRRNR